MNCETTRRLIDAYMDSELDSSNAIEIEEHLSECDGCRSILESRQELSRAIKSAATYAPVPDSLRIQIRKEVRVTPRIRFGLMSTGIAFAVGVILMLAVWRPWSSVQDRMIGDVLSQHELAVASHKPTELTSADPKKLQSWFADKAGFIPTVPRLSAQGFDLSGGRLGVVGGRTVPVLVYRHGKHDIDIFVTFSGENPPIDADRDGIHVRTWNDCGIDYWAVSDDSPSDLATLHKEFLKHKQ